MIDENKFLDLCNTKGLKPFKVTTDLDYDTDIILDTEDISAFFELCECYGTKCIFYSFINQTKDAYELDKGNLISRLREQIDIEGIRYHYDPYGYNDEDIDFNALIEKYSFVIDEIIENQNDLLEAHTWGTPLMLEVFISVSGDRIGMTIFTEDNSIINQFKSNEDVFKELKCNIEEEITFFYKETSRYKAENYERENKEREERYNQAIEEIKEVIQTSEKILDCTNAKLRHAYAKELANEYAEKYDCYITIGEVEVFVDEEYKKNKKYMHRK